jgi:lipopolysaccharide/colanic/teichoic acid biosynthesis glycosyltransferase
MEPTLSSTELQASSMLFLPTADRRRRTSDTEVPLPLSPGQAAIDQQARRAPHGVRMTDDMAAFRPRRRSEMVNRAMNLTLAVVALLLVSPLMLIIAALVKLTSRGPVLYVQTRVGIDRRSRGTLAMFDRRGQDHGGKTFRIYKFRSMRMDAEARTGAVWATADDPRVTPLGRILRKSRLDELPQLFNVVRGDMNIVGPRPERPSIFVKLREDIVEYPLRQRAKPGITGLAQISQSYDACLDDVRNKVRYDLEYLEKQSLAEDVRIMLKTVPVVLFRKGGW